jgi:aminopeptidase-like protein
VTCPGYHAVSRAIDGLAADRDRLGREMYELVERLYPIPRSITGDGVRETLRIVRETLAEGGRGNEGLTLHEVPSGTPVLDWTVPQEWTVREASIKDPSGRKVVDFADHTLHLLGYSVPVHRTMPLAELREHLHSLPEQPDLIPYRTSYYAEAWGFCLPHRLLESLPEGEYEVKIDSELSDGALTYGELSVPGETEDEVLVSCHVCHPSLANDNLSGLAVTLFLARELMAMEDLRYTYRFVWVPGTIGAIAWLARNPDAAGRIAHGLVAANLGDSGPFHYKRSQREDAPIDRAVAHVLSTGEASDGNRIESWVPFGYDERQYNSPGFDLPVGLLSRTPWGRFPEYHTSADDLSFVAPGNLAGSLETYLRVMAILEGDLVYTNLRPHGEPQLGRRGLYSKLGGDSRSKDGRSARERQLDLLWVLNQSNGERSLLDVAERAGRPFAAIRAAADLLCDAGLLEARRPPGEDRPEEGAP